MSTPDNLTIERYLAGDASPEERRAVELWLQDNPLSERLLAQVRREVVGAEPTLNATRGWQQLEPQLSRRRWLAPRRIVWAAAASAALWVGAYAWTTRELQLTAAPGTSPSVTLADGSIVQLAPGAGIKWRARAGKERRVELTGEAWFNVVHSSVPFRVYAGDAVIEDIGTRFVVDADVPSGTVDVAVEEGEVALTPSSPRSSAPHRLVAGQGASIDRDGRISAIQDVDDRLAWVSGSLTWHDVALQKVAEDLERWFDVEVVLDAALTTRQVTARYSRDAGIAPILQGLAAALGANVSNSGSLWRITGISR